MNLLIKQLAKDAKINLLLTDKKKLELFANLIVDQCAKVCETGNVDGWVIDNNISRAFATEVRKRFKQFDSVKDKK